MSKKLQTGLALGAMVLRPLGPDTAEYVAADKFIVISFSDDGTPNDIAFLVVKCAGKMIIIPELNALFYERQSDD